MEVNDIAEVRLCIRRLLTLIEETDIKEIDTINVVEVLEDYRSKLENRQNLLESEHVRLKGFHR